jgi:hypothetical protein
MFKLTTSNQTPKPKRTLYEGFPDVDASVPDICIINETNINSAILLNSKMLRQALLADPNVTKQLLGIIVEDATIVKPKKLVKKSTQQKAVLKAIEEEADE